MLQGCGAQHVHTCLWGSSGVGPGRGPVVSTPSAGRPNQSTFFVDVEEVLTWWMVLQV